MRAFDAIYAPIDGFLPYLAVGWRFADDIAEPMPAHHGHWSVLLVRAPRRQRGNETARSGGDRAAGEREETSGLSQVKG